MKKILYHPDFVSFGGAETYFIDLILNIDRTKYEPVCILFRGSDSRKLKEKLSPAKTYELSRPAVFKLISIIREEKPDIVHLNMNVPFSCFYMLFILKLLNFKSVIATIHSAIAPRSRYPFLRGIKSLLCKMLFPVVEKFVCVSKSSKAEFCRNYDQPENKVAAVYNGIKPFLDRPYGTDEAVLAKESFGVTGKMTVIGCVARLDRDKGVEYLLKAFAELCKERKDISCLIAGEGMDIDRLKNIAKASGVSDRIVFAGNVEDKKRMFAAIDIFVLPSLHEAFPLTILEAMHSGKPVVATAVGGVLEMIENGVTGSLVPPKDADAIKKALVHLLGNSAEAGKMGALGMQAAKTLFSFEKMIEDTEMLYEGLTI